MAGIENLNPPIQSTEEARELGRKGGIASGESKRKRRLMKDTLLLLLASKTVPEGQKAAIAAMFGVSEEDVDYHMAICAKQVIKAADGKDRSFENVRDGIGEMPVKKIGFGDEEKTPLEEMAEKLIKQKLAEQKDGAE